MGILKEILFVFYFLGCYSSCIEPSQKSILRSQNIFAEVKINSRLLDFVSDIGKYSDSTISLEIITSLNSVELDGKMFESVLDLDLINGWDANLSIDSVETKDAGWIIYENDRSEFIESIKPKTKIFIVGNKKITEELIGILIRVNMKIDPQIESSKVYLLCIQDKKLKSIVQVSYRFSGDGNIMEGKTVAKSNQKFRFQERIIASDTEYKDQKRHEGQWLSPQHFRINSDGYIEIF